MASEKPRNLAASVQAKIHNRRFRTGESYDTLLRRYAVEGFIRRLAVSPHRDRFILKGAMLFVVWGIEEHRATRDVDFLGFGDLSLDAMKSIIREIVGQPGCDDGLVFLTETIDAEVIREENEYGGVRVTMTAMLPPARIPMQADIGTGDAVAECPFVEFPALLDSACPKIRAYPKESSIAEKFHAIVDLDMKNTRMKDFYDIWTLSNRFEFDLEALASAVRATFLRRDTPLPKRSPTGLTDVFSDDSGKRTQWEAFLRKSAAVPPHADLRVVIGRLAAFLEPVREEILSPTGRMAKWNPNAAAWEP